MRSLLFFIFLLWAGIIYGQDGLPILVTSTSTGKIYQINADDCSGRLICTTGKDFNDIAFTPNGKLWGRTLNSLFRIDTATGQTALIGSCPIGNGLVGLNDTTLFIDSAHYLLRIKTTNGSTHLIGDMGYPLHGDYTWVGKYLYASAYATGGLIRITLDSTYNYIQAVDTIVDTNDIYIDVTPALASIKIDSTHYSLIAFRGDTVYSKLDPETGEHHILCYGSVVSTSGAASGLFPPPPPGPITTINEQGKNSVQLTVYPNPTQDKLFIASSKPLDKYTITLTDIHGNIFLQEKGHGTLSKFDIAGYSSGLYFIQIKDSQGSTILVLKVLKS